MDALTARRIVDCVLADVEIPRAAALEIGGDVLMRRLLEHLAELRGRVGCLPAGAGMTGDVSEVFRDAMAARLRVLSAIRRGEIVTASMIGAACWNLRLSDAALRARYLRQLVRTS